MKSKLFWPSVIAGFITLAFSCKKEQKKTPSNTIAPPSAIYIAGSIAGDAVYWKNGTAVTLQNTNASVTLHNMLASSVFISGSDVYLSGFGATPRKIDTPVYWKNDNLNTVDNSIGTAQALAIAVIGNDVYLGGSQSTVSGYKGVLWKNGESDNFGSSQTAINGITTDNNDLYTAGPDDGGPGGRWMASYYKNQQKVALNSNNQRAWAYEVAVSGSDVYVAGNIIDANDVYYAVYWKNGVMNTIGGPNSGAVSICVSNGDVYVGGTDEVGTYGVATYWKNGVPTHLVANPTSGSECNEIKIWGNDVYVVGAADNTNQGYQAILWKNGTATILGPPPSFAFNIAFKP